MSQTERPLTIEDLQKRAILVGPEELARIHLLLHPEEIQNGVVGVSPEMQKLRDKANDDARLKKNRLESELVKQD